VAAATIMTPFDRAARTAERAPWPVTLEIPKEGRALVIGAEHRVRTGDLRLGNEPVRHPRSSPALHESSRSFDYLGFLRTSARLRFHDSPRRFSTLMCPACATPPQKHGAAFRRRCAGRSATRLLDRARVRAVRGRQVAPLSRLAQRHQVRLQGAWTRSALHDRAPSVAAGEARGCSPSASR
jgi:hypothetical protein